MPWLDATDPYNLGACEITPRPPSAQAVGTPRHRALASSNRATLPSLVRTFEGGMTAAEAACASGLYHDLAAALVSHLARTADNPAVAGEQAGRDWGRRLAIGNGAESRIPQPPATDTPADDVVGVPGRLGFTPHAARRDTDGGLIHLRTCLSLDLVKANQDVVCGMHLGIIRGALGGLGVSTAGTAPELFSADGTYVVRIGSGSAFEADRR